MHERPEDRQHQIQQVAAEKDQRRYDDADDLRVREEELQNEIDILRAPWNPDAPDAPRLLPEDIAEMVAMWTGIPVFKLTEAESQKLIRMEEEMRLAREIHDGLAQTLAFLKIEIGRAAQGKSKRLLSMPSARAMLTKEADMDARQFGAEFIELPQALVIGQIAFIGNIGLTHSMDSDPTAPFGQALLINTLHSALAVRSP